ncbi:MAG: hypothetical protein ACRDOI_16445 [Trebonia sp.]
MTRGPRRDFGGGDRGFDRRPAGDSGGDRSFGGGDRRPDGDRDGGRSYGGDRRPGGDRSRPQGADRDSGGRDGGFRGREGGYGRDGGDRRPTGYRSGQDGPSRSGRPPYGRTPESTDRPRGQGFSRTMSDRIGGAFPDDRAARAPRPGSGDRPGARGTSYGAGARTARPSGNGAGPGAGRGRPNDRRDDRRTDDRRGGGADAPRIPDSITDDQVSREVREELGSLSLDRASLVGRYLIAAELATDPEQAYRYAQAAKQLAARVGIVREVSGIMAYKSGRWAEALTELQAGRRMTGRNDYLPLMADAERGLSRLDRALDLTRSAEAKRLPRAAQIELRIVESGIRRDQGLADASVLALQVPELTDGKQRPWSARLFYAYGEALLAADRADAAREAFSRAVVADEDEQTDALARLDELDGISVQDLEDDEDDEFGGDDDSEDEGDAADDTEKDPAGQADTLDEEDEDEEADDDAEDDLAARSDEDADAEDDEDDDLAARSDEDLEDDDDEDDDKDEDDDDNLDAETDDDLDDLDDKGNAPAEAPAAEAPVTPPADA